MKTRSHWPISIFSIFSAIISLLVPLILVRVLSPEEVGRFKIFFLYLLLSPILTFTAGFQNGLSYWGGQEKDWRRAYHATTLYVLCGALLATAVILVFHEFLSARIGLQAVEMQLFAGTLLCILTSNIFEDAAIGRGRIWTLAMFHTVFELMRVIAMITAAFCYRSLTAVLIAHAISVLCRALGSVAFGIRFGYIGLNVDREIFEKVLCYAFPISSAWIFGIFVTHVDQLLLSQYIAPADFAVYTLGCLSVPPLLILERSITRVLIPEMAESFSGNNTQKAVRQYSRAVGSLAFFMIPAAAGLSIFARPIIELLFTHRYSSAAEYLQVFAFYYVLLLLPYDVMARAKGDVLWIFKNLVICSLVSLALTLLLVQSHGALGALWGLLISGCILRITGSWYMVGASQHSLSEFIPIRKLLSISLITLCCSFMSFALRDHFTSEINWFFLVAPLFAILYFFISCIVKLICFNAIDLSDESRNPVILTILQNLNIGGLERMVLSLNVGIQREGTFRPVVTVYDQDERLIATSLYSEFVKESIAVSLFSKGKGFSVRFVYRLWRCIRDEDVSIIHCHDLGGLIYASFVKVLCMRPVALVMTQHSFVHLERHWRYRVYEVVFTLLVDRLIVVSEATKQQYRSLCITWNNVSIIPNGVIFPDCFVPRPFAREKLFQQTSNQDWLKLYPHSKRFWILYLGRMFPGKGQHEALSIWCTLSEEQQSNALLLIVGPECDKEYCKRFNELLEATPVRDHIIYVGATTDPNAWISASDMFLSCSSFEGMPLAPLEALGSGIPTVLSAIPGHMMFEEYALLYPPEEPECAGDAICKLIDQIEVEPEQHWYRTKALREKYSLQGMVRSYSRLYEEIAFAGRELELPLEVDDLRGELENVY